MTNPLIRIDDELREMTDEEYAELLARGWTMEGTNEATIPDADTGISPE
jgi:hypothetical protein